MNNFEILITSSPDREELVAEVWYCNKFWVEISEEVVGKFVVQFYNHPEKDCWEFSWEEAMQVLNEAKDRLAGMKRIDPESGQADDQQ